MKTNSRVALAAGVAVALSGITLARAQEHDQPEHESSAGAAMPMEALAAEAGTPDLPAESPLVEVRLREEERRIELVIGPVELPAGGPHIRPAVQLAELPVAGWLHEFAWEMRDAEGNPLPDRLLHHVNLIDPDRRELFSPVARRVLAAGRETKSASIPDLLGVPLEEGTRYLISAMFASRPDESYDQAFLHIELRYTPHDGHGIVRPRAVYPFYLDVMGPVGEKEFPLPPGTHGRSWEGSPAISGRILLLGGHLHDFGDWIRLEDVTTGKVVWETGAEHDESGGVIGVPVGKLWWKGGIPVHADHAYRLSVQYTNPTERDAPDMAMGALGGVLLAGRGAWPAFDREDPDYVADLRNTLEKPNEAHHGHGEMYMTGTEGGADAGAGEHDHATHAHGVRSGT